MSTGKSSGEFFVLTPKGAQELHNSHLELDATAKNILQLIEQGAATAEAILERSMFPHNTVIEGLRRLLSNNGWRRRPMARARRNRPAFQPQGAPVAGNCA